ncbi:MAG: PEP-CTERM sorting domain-containing protein [Kiritimatiellae bacterium]|nr:PEP-CTERM sorting domain-containing protein [Kiritimatiellia bacterium]
MKTKLITACLAAMLTTSASALSFDWAATGVSFNGTRLKSNESVSGYLIYLGSSGSLSGSYDISSDTISTIVSEIGTQVSTVSKTSSMSKLTGTYETDYGTAGGRNGDVFAMLLTFTNEGTTYYNLSSTTFTLSGVADDGAVIDAQAFSFSYSTADASTSVSKGGGWTAAAVPEPSTAALALAGLALLLKRRKA